MFLVDQQRIADSMLRSMLIFRLEACRLPTESSNRMQPKHKAIRMIVSHAKMVLLTLDSAIVLWSFALLVDMIIVEHTGCITSTYKALLMRNFTVIVSVCNLLDRVVYIWTSDFTDFDTHLDLSGLSGSGILGPCTGLLTESGT